MYIHTHAHKMKFGGIRKRHQIFNLNLNSHLYIYIYTVLYTSCRHNSHDAAKGISCVAGAVKNTRQTCNSACTWSNNPNSFAILGKNLHEEKNNYGTRSTMEKASWRAGKTAIMYDPVQISNHKIWVQLCFVWQAPTKMRLQQEDAT